MIYFNGEMPHLNNSEKIASPLITFVICASIITYVWVMNYLLPSSTLFVR